MPKKPETISEAVRPYIFHGLDLNYGNGGVEAIAECPFCGKEKFSINTETSLYRCWSGSCGVEGNSSTFLKEFWQLCYENTLPADYRKLAEESGFLNPESANVFGCAKSLLTNNWLVPGYNVDLQLTGLYRYCKIKEKHSDKWVNKLLPTPGMGHHLFNLHNWEDSKPIVDICEGWRDGIAWMESLGMTYQEDGESHYDIDRNVVSIPGANSFKARWTKLFAGKTVNILFDNDHPLEKGDSMVDGAGLKGVKRVASILTSSKTPPAAVNFLSWNSDGSGVDTELPNKMDLRDFLMGVK